MLSQRPLLSEDSARKAILRKPNATNGDLLLYAVLTTRGDCITFAIVGDEYLEREHGQTLGPAAAELADLYSYEVAATLDIPPTFSCQKCVKMSELFDEFADIVAGRTNIHLGHRLSELVVDLSNAARKLGFRQSADALLGSVQVRPCDRKLRRNDRRSVLTNRHRFSPSEYFCPSHDSLTVDGNKPAAEGLHP